MLTKAELRADPMLPVARAVLPAVTMSSTPNLKRNRPHSEPADKPGLPEIREPFFWGLEPQGTNSVLQRLTGKYPGFSTHIHQHPFRIRGLQFRRQLLVRHQLQADVTVVCPQ